MSKSQGSKYERELMAILQMAGLSVVRSAGSHGEGDLAIFNPMDVGVVFHYPHCLTEAKKRPDGVYYPSGEKEQWDAACQRSGNVPYFYGVRSTEGPYDERGWEFFKVTPAMEGEYPPLRAGEGMAPRELFLDWPAGGYRAVN